MTTAINEVVGKFSDDEIKSLMEEHRALYEKAEKVLDHHDQVLSALIVEAERRNWDDREICKHSLGCSHT